MALRSQLADPCRDHDKTRQDVSTTLSGSGGSSIVDHAEDDRTVTRTLYEKDVVRWAQEQARLLRAGDLSHLDIEHIADEIEDVGKAEQRELASRTAVLLAHLLKWRFQPQHRSKSWRVTIDNQRKGIARRIQSTPSLKATLRDTDWQADIWPDAVNSAIAETGLDPDLFPAESPWSIEQALDASYWPE